MSTRENSMTGAGPGGARSEQPDGMADRARQQADEVKEQARGMAEDVQHQARAKGEEIRDRVEQQGEQQKERAAGTADALAEAIRAAGSTLRDRDEQRLGQFTDEFADQVERLGGYLRDNDMRGLMHGLEDVARKNPTGFLGSTLAAGIVAGRFLRSSGRDTESGIESNPDRHARTQHRPPSHKEFASNPPAPDFGTPREAASSSSAPEPALTSRDRETTNPTGGLRS